MLNIENVDNFLNLFLIMEARETPANVKGEETGHEVLQIKLKALCFILLELHSQVL